MLVNLTIIYSKSVKSNLVENKTLEEIDKITSIYLDEEELKNSSNFKEQVNTFYRRYYNYFNKIQDREKRKTQILITYYDKNNVLKSMAPIYYSTNNKLKTTYLVNKIETTLKKIKSKDLILKIYREKDFLKSEYNYRANNIGYCIQLISIYGVSDITKKQYNKLVKVIKETILQECNNSYFYAREIYDIISNYQSHRGKLTSISKDNIEVLKESYTTVKVPKRKRNYYGAGDYYLTEDNDREEKRWIKR